MEYNILIETDFSTCWMQVIRTKVVTLWRTHIVSLSRCGWFMQHQREASGLCTVIRRDRAWLSSVNAPYKGLFGNRRLVCAQGYCIVRRMQEHVAATYHLHVTTSTSEASPPVSLESKPLVKWTGNAVDLVEMVYGICVMGSVNDGDVKFKDLAQAMYQFFGIKAKDCYRFYTDIRRRKNHSRTYFLDRMQEKLNDKMRRMMNWKEWDDKNDKSHICMQGRVTERTIPKSYSPYCLFLYEML